ncbi:unnamed protein product [Rangifer tarandus platyrhynchus]|uniref:Uncharacterized protein n=2 Tax=Rangifer tarandus platyrhynchus TaxID=3082113 RepID=A0AC59YV84_RANTA|nr:unnamed protein product [Rangifer tarandus platyrhynchus]
MDKNIGEQLNKAYEAFRQACMDRDSAVKELQQKTENYEQRIREQQEQLSHQQTLIDKLKSQLLLVNSSRDNSCGYVPLLEDKVSSPRKETSPRSLGIPLFHERSYIEKTFWDLKEEFHGICMLAKAQKDHLSKLNVPTTAAETQCSMPIQCTDKTDKQEVLFKPQAKDDINRGAPCITSVTSRGLGQDEEDTSFESLSKFNVKFPPTDNDLTFLHSTPERPDVLGSVTAETDPSDAPFPSLDSPGKAIRGPQQPIWKPFPNQDSDLSVPSGTGSELHIPRVCEFCQAVFPPFITSRGDFLRHLNSHFNGET